MPDESAPDLVESVRSKASDLKLLDRRDFERVVAELLASFGWQVSLTSPTRDGGRDILALSRDASGLRTSWLVECRQYHRHQAIDIATIQRLGSTKEHFGFPNALIATTSSATEDAQVIAQAHGIHIVGLAKLLEWIDRYQRPQNQQSFAQQNRFRSCFVSYSHKDEAFVTHLVGKLRAAGVHIWFAPEDMPAGHKLDEEISRAITNFDRLLVVLSQNSINSEWVKAEIKKARKREVAEGKRVLFPISLIDFEALRRWELFDADVGQDLAAELRAYYIPDFSEWERTDSFQRQFAKVLVGLEQ
jgi:hypothetical protein